MTLILVVPTGEGAVVAADSIAVDSGQRAIEDRAKLQPVSAVTICAGIGITDLSALDHDPTLPPQFSLGSILTAEVKARARPFISKAIMRVAASAVAMGVRDVMALDPRFPAAMAGRFHAGGVVVQFGGVDRVTRVGSFAVVVTEEETSVARDVELTLSRPTGPRELHILGGSDYVHAHVLPPGSAGSEFLDVDVRAWVKQGRVAETRATDAATIARAIIRATELTCTVVPRTQGPIGGEPVVLLLDGVNEPKAI